MGPKNSEIPTLKLIITDEQYQGLTLLFSIIPDPLLLSPTLPYLSILRNSSLTRLFKGGASGVLRKGTVQCIVGNLGAVFSA